MYDGPLAVGEAGDVRAGGEKIMVRRRFSRRSRALRGVVVVRAGRAFGGGGSTRLRRLVLLDETDSRRNRLHRRISFYVHSMQSVHYIVQEVASV